MYESRGRARRPAAFDALTPEHQHNRQHDEDDAAENPSDDRGCLVAMMTVVLGRGCSAGHFGTISDLNHLIRQDRIPGSSSHIDKSPCWYLRTIRNRV